MSARDPEIPMSDPELDALMAELEDEVGGAVAAPAPVAAPVAVAKKTVTEEVASDETVVVDDEEAEINAMIESEVKDDGTPLREAPVAAPAPPEIPKGSDPVASEESNFVLPPKMRAAADADAADRKPTLKVVPPAPAPAAAEATTPGTMASEPDHNKKPAAAPGLRYGIDVAAFKVETAIKPTDLDNAMIEQSALRAYYHEQAALAEAQHARLKARFEVKEAELYDKHRKALAITGEKVTEKAVENAVKLDPAWLRMKNTVIDADTISNVNRGLVESLKDRSSMLVQLGADRRIEGQGQLRVMADQDLRQRAQDAARR